MFPRTFTVVLLLVGAVAFLPDATGSTQHPRIFTVADEIQLAHFGDPYSFEAEAVQFSPDRNYFAVDTESGSLDLNHVQDSLRFYRGQDVQRFLDHSLGAQPPSPVWVVNRSGKEGPIIKEWRWLADSSGVAFLERDAGCIQRLVLASLQQKTIQPLTSPTETVRAFDVRDRSHYVYTVADLSSMKEVRREFRGPSVLGSGRSIIQLLVPDDPTTARISSPHSYLWAVIGKRFKVTHNGTPLEPGELVLSPDGRSLLTTLPVSNVPRSWETLYPPPFSSDPYRIRAGGFASQYVRIDLEAGLVQVLADAPTSADADWQTLGRPNWSHDGQSVILPGTFLRSPNHLPSRPCVAAVDLRSQTRACVETLKGHTETGVEEGYHFVSDAHFVYGDRRRIVVIFRKHDDFLSFGSTEYRLTDRGSWQAVGQNSAPWEVGHNDLEVTIEQGLNKPPQLVAKHKQTERVIWDPNPQLKNIELGEVSVYRWKDKEGRDWKGGLFKPSDYKAGHRYPLVIQTHDFSESEFRPSGYFPTAFAARALAAAGILVLQIGEHCPGATPSEGACAVSGYESGVRQLVSEGDVDVNNIGIVGFSRSCFYVMKALTTSSLHFKAASITDGFIVDYLQYMMAVTDEDSAREADSMIGARPFGAGLQQWLKLSPSFNLDKIHSPLLVVAEGPLSLVYMWGPYAGLRYLQKPVELVMLNTDEHVLTNPAVRMTSQGGTVDWFRFWLQDKEDSNPAKCGQYTRWRKLRQLQDENYK